MRWSVQSKKSRKRPEPTALRALDFFCGAGGLTRGLLDSGVRVAAGFDIDESCCRTFEQNNSGVRFIRADVRELTASDVLQVIGSTDPEHVLLAGCAPCQSFSPQRKGSGRRSDATLLGEFGRLVEGVLPGHVIVENVPGMQKVRGFSTFRRFLHMLDAKEYRYVYGVLDAKVYGVPQNRRRLVLVASRTVRPFLPKAQFGPGRRAYKTVRQAISHFPGIKAGERHPAVPNHVAASVSELNAERLRSTPHDGGDRRSWPADLELQCHKGTYKGHTDVYGRMHWDQPAPALTGRCNSISNGRYGHPEQDRAISLREAAALQTFPDGYEFFGPDQRIARHIGNAVPVRLAEELGKSLLLSRTSL